MQTDMKKKLTLLLFSICILNVDNSYAQNTSLLANTVWEFQWDKNLHRDFILFCDNKAVYYSYEIDEFEFLEYTVQSDTVILSTSSVYDKHDGELRNETVIYYFLLNNNCLSLLFSLRKKDEDRKYFYYPSNPYILCMIKF